MFVFLNTLDAHMETNYETRKVEGWRSRQERELRELRAEALNLPLETSFLPKKKLIFDGFGLREVQAVVNRPSRIRSDAFRELRKLRVKAWARANPDKVRERRKKYIEKIGLDVYRANYRTYVSQRYHADIDFRHRLLESSARWQRANPEKAREKAARYREKNRDLINLRQRERRKRVPLSEFEKDRAAMYLQILRLAGLHPEQQNKPNSRPLINKGVGAACGRGKATPGDGAKRNEGVQPPDRSIRCEVQQ
jgi:hypothetical protein